MRNRPNAGELLDIAEKTLTSEVAPDMSNRQRYNVALIASAIAQRDRRRHLRLGWRARHPERSVRSGPAGNARNDAVAAKPKAGS